MVTELFSNFDEFESKSSFVMDIGFGAMGANVGFSMSKESQRYRSAFDEFEIGVSKQKYKVYQLSLKKDIYGTCPYNEAVFAAEKDTVNTASGRESPSVRSMMLEHLCRSARSLSLSHSTHTHSTHNRTVKSQSGKQQTVRNGLERLNFQSHLQRNLRS